MQTEKRVFSKLFNETPKTTFTKHRAELGITQDLETAVGSFGNTLNTGEKVLQIALRVNNVLENVTDEVRYYNDYKAATLETINQNIDFVQGLVDKAQDLANELGVPTDFNGNYQEALNYIDEAVNLKNLINDNPLVFDI